MRRARKVMPIILATALASSALMGCGSSGDSSTQSDSTAQSSTAAQSATTAQTAADQASGETFKIATVRWNDAWPEDFLTTGVMGELAQKAGINIDWQVYYASTFDEQKGLLFAGGDLPDAFFGSCKLLDSDISQNKDNLVELTDLIKDNMPNLSRIMDEDPNMRAAAEDRDGKIWSLPKKLPFRPKVGNQNYINKTWLDRLGLDMPTNYDELKDVLLAFKNEDADGDGDPNDEIPLSLYKGMYGWDFTLLDSYDLIYRGEDFMALDANDKVVFLPAQENYKQAVEYYRDLWENGVMDPEYFTQDQAMYTAKLQRESGSQIGIFSGWTADSWAGANTSEFVEMPTLEGPNGTKNAPSMTTTDYSDKELIITKNCKDPAKLLQWADQFYDDVVSLQTYYGSISTGQVKDNGDGTYEVLVPQDETLDTSAWENSPRDFGPKYMSKDFESKVTLPEDQGDGVKLKEDELNSQYVDNPDLLHCMPGTVKFTDDEVTERANLNADISQYVSSQWSHWISEGGVDDEWDAYLKQLDDMGLQRLIEINQNAYDAYKAKYE